MLTFALNVSWVVVDLKERKHKEPLNVRKVFLESIARFFIWPFVNVHL